MENCNVVLTGVPEDKKGKIISILRSEIGINLTGAKVMVANLPSIVKANVSKDVADEIASNLIAAGAEVSVQT